MPSVVEVTDPLRAIYRPVAPAGPGVCLVCHSQPNPGFAVCYRCELAMSQVTHPLRLVVPISLAAKGEQLYFTLRSYKNPGSLVSRRFRGQIAAIIGRFLEAHGDCIRGAGGGDWDMVTIVPSTRGRTGPHPLATAIRMLSPRVAEYQDTLRPNAAWTGAAREAADDRFEVTADVGGRSILVVDDTFTTGAHVQSVASALVLAGASVVAAVPVGRIIGPEFSPDVWATASASMFDFDRCCLEA